MACSMGRRGIFVDFFFDDFLAVDAGIFDVLLLGTSSFLFFFIVLVFILMFIVLLRMVD